MALPPSSETLDLSTPRPPHLVSFCGLLHTKQKRAAIDRHDEISNDEKTNSLGAVVYVWPSFFGEGESREYWAISSLTICFFSLVQKARKQQVKTQASPFKSGQQEKNEKSSKKASRRCQLLTFSLVTIVQNVPKANLLMGPESLVYGFVEPKVYSKSTPFLLGTR